MQTLCASVDLSSCAGSTSSIHGSALLRSWNNISSPRSTARSDDLEYPSIRAGFTEFALHQAGQCTANQGYHALPNRKPNHAQKQNWRHRCTPCSEDTATFDNGDDPRSTDRWRGMSLQPVAGPPGSQACMHQTIPTASNTHTHCSYVDEE